MQGVLEPFIDRLKDVTSLDGLKDEIIGLRDHLDVDNVAYHSVNSTGDEYAVTTYSAEWHEQYMGLDYSRIDPVVQGCFRRFHPVNWNRLDWSAKPVRNFRDEATSSGVGNQGYSVPIRGPNGQFALFTVSHECSDDKWASYTNEHMRDLILVAHFVNQRALEIERGTDHTPIQQLSPREVDTLTMLAMGYSRAQAAESLQISEHTLRVYIESARFKLGALNTTHAVARALTLGVVVV